MEAPFLNCFYAEASVRHRPLSTASNPRLNQPVTNLVRQEIMTAADTVVVKVGSRVLTREDGALDDSRVAAIAEQLARLRLDGRKVVLVSSGAVAAGIGRLGWKRRPTDLAELQAAAAVGEADAFAPIAERLNDAGKDLHVQAQAIGEAVLITR